MDLIMRAWDIHHEDYDYIEDLYWFEENMVREVTNDIADAIHAKMIIEFWTQRTDIKGKKIYVNDIVKDERGDTGLVIFKDFMFTVQGFLNPYHDCPTVAFQEGVFEVIGNAHENPELLDQLDHV